MESCIAKVTNLGQTFGKYNKISRSKQLISVNQVNIFEISEAKFEAKMNKLALQSDAGNEVFDEACLEGVPTMEIHGELHTGLDKRLLVPDC